jgi:hypothetical protein
MGTISYRRSQSVSLQRRERTMCAASGLLPGAAAAWSGYGLPRHALYTDHDVKFWLDVLVREGKLKPGQLGPEDIATNKYNANAQLSQ